MRAFLGVFLLTLLFIMMVGLAGAAGEYELDYDVISNGGSVSQTTDYDVVDMITCSGVSGAVQSTTSYTIEPVVGDSDTPPASVDSWILH